MSETLPAELRGLIAAAEAELPPPIPASLHALVYDWIAARENVEALELLLKDARVRLDQLRKLAIPDKMRELGLVAGQHGSFTHESGASVSLRVDTYASVRKTDEAGHPTDAEAQLLAWLRANGHGDLIKEAVNPQTLRAFVREREGDGLPLPPGVTVYRETVAVLTKPRGRADEQG